jgi:hypothetical protein
MVTPGVTARPLRASVQVQRDDDHWLVRLQTESGDQSGLRILRAESCKELKEAIALLLAMAMESKGEILPAEPPAPAPETPAAAPAPPPAAAAPAERVPPTAAPAPPNMQDGPPASADVRTSGVALGWFLRLDGKAAAGLKPGLGLGVGIAGGLRIGDFDVGVGAAHWPNSRKPARNRQAFIDIDRQNLGLHACWNAWRTGALVLAPCLAPGLVVFHFQTTGLRSTEQGDAKPLPTVTASADLRYELLDGSLSFLVSPGVTWEQPRPFTIGLTDAALPAEGPPPIVEIEEIYKTRGFGPRLEIGVDARF